MILTIEFPMYILASYHGISNLDVTLDDNISYLIGKHFRDFNISFNILTLEFISPKPNINDKLVQYKIELNINATDFDYKPMLDLLKNAGFEKGLTIKSTNKIIYADQFTADIPYRRSLN